ncbi:hypothetical protein LCGC14_1620120 [marine sediment metagenome]|uniref:Uncharacterized protein n=1 Tax=marine sediment metagenome TaxID=412755 RepID=A0A0F9L5N0_9ZZZZ
MAKKNGSTKPVLTDAQKKQVKMDNFARVCTSRMDKALKAIRMVGDCSNPTYLHTDEQGNVCINALRTAVEDVENRFAGIAGKAGGFALPK